MANPFEVQVPNVLQSLMQFDQGYKGMREMRQNRALDDVGEALSSGNYEDAAKAAFRAGKLDTGLALIKMRQEEGASTDFRNMIGGMYPNKPSSPLQQLMSPQPAQQPAGDPASAISSIESGGRYDALGPVTKTGDRAYGKYQVMGANIGPWTKEALGREMTPQEFAASPEAQDAVFKAKFGQYSQKYGPEGAARAWFAGEGGMNDLGRKDQLGTTVAQYGQRFAQAAGIPQAAAPAQFSGSPQPAASPTSTLPTALMQDPATAKIGELLAASVNPRLPAPQKEVAKTLLAHALKASELTPDQKEYVGAVAQGETRTFTDWKMGMKRAGATNVSVGDNSKKFDEELDKKTADRFGKYIDNADAARRKMVDIDTMREISGRLGVQGAAAGIKEAIGPYADALGINVDGLSDIQAYTQVIQRLAPQQRAPGSGSTSDIEFKGFLKSLPGLSQNPAAREIGLNTMEALARDEIARGEIATKVSTKELTRVEGEKELRALPDPMKGFVEWRKANPQLYGQALMGAAPPAAPAQSSGPPMQGARQAPDGKYYIQRGNQWFRVEQ